MDRGYRFHEASRDSLVRRSDSFEHGRTDVLELDDFRHLRAQGRLQERSETGSLISVGLQRQLQRHDVSDGESSADEEENTARQTVTTIDAGEPPSGTPRGLGDFWDDVSLDSWALELVSCTFAGCCLIAIVIILLLYDNRPLPHWPLGITINSFISLFLTLGRAALIFPVSQAISQLKWIWYTNHENPALDLDDFDRASRGPLGSSKFLASRKVMSLASFGALITLLALALSPVTQQAVKYVPKSIADPTDGAATSPCSEYFDAVDPLTGGPIDTYNLDTATTGAIYTGLLANANATLPHLDPFCSTANCNWTEYKTLGVCASLADVSDLLTAVCEAGYGGTLTCNVALPGGPTLVTIGGGAFRFVVRSMYYLLGPDGGKSSVPLGTPHVLDSQAFKDVLPNTLADFFVIWPSTLGEFQAAEINLQYCVQTLVSGVKGGKAYTDVVDWYTDFRKPPNDIFANWTATPPGSAKNYSVSPEVWNNFPRHMNVLFNGILERGGDGGNSGYPTPAIEAISAAIYLPPYNIAGLRSMAKNLATSMTNNMRLYRHRGAPAIGQATLQETYVQISWQWLTLVAALVVSSFMFLLLVMGIARHKKNKLWKSSNLALLRALHVDPTARPPRFEGLKDNISMKKQADGVRLTLEQGAGLWKLSYPGSRGAP